MFHLLLVTILIGNVLIVGGLGMFGIIFLGSVIPHIAVTIRRYHDQGLSGWYYLWSFFPYIGGLISIYFMVQVGTPDENKWGSDPLMNGVDADIFS